MILGSLVGAVIGANFELLTGSANANIRVDQIVGRVLEAATQFSGPTLLLAAGAVAGGLVGALLLGRYLDLLLIIIMGMFIGLVLEQDGRTLVGPYLGLRGEGGLFGAIVGAGAGGLAIFSPLARKVLLGVFLGGSLGYAVTAQMAGSRLMGAILGALIAVGWAMAVERWPRQPRPTTSDEDTT